MKMKDCIVLIIHNVTEAIFKVFVNIVDGDMKYITQKTCMLVNSLFIQFPCLQ